MGDIDYSETIENSMAHGNKELIQFAHMFRKSVEESGIECLCSYRTIKRIALLEKVIDNLYEVLSISLLKGLNKEDLDTIRTRLAKEDKTNKYAKALLNFDF